MKLIFIVNAGSSSIKFQVMDKETLTPISSGLLERIYVDGVYSIKYGDKKFEGNADFKDHDVSIDFLVKKLKEIGVLKSVEDIVGIGHRIVHGGMKYRKATLVNDEVLKVIEDLIPIAPLHNPGGLAGIKGFLKVAPHAINVAQFDTSFHHTIPDYNYTYALPEEWREKYKVRRYGMHGISYEYITMRMSEILNKKNPNLLIAHLGNGASICAVKEGKSYNTSMSFTALAGLIMGTRSGDIGPGIIEYIASQTGMTTFEVNSMLNKASGLKGLTGHSDMREIEEAALKGEVKSIFAIKLWSRRIATYFVDYFNQLGGKLDAIVFTAGIGENSSFGRQHIINEIMTMGLEINKAKNEEKYGDHKVISTSSSKFPIYVTRTNEELMIAKRVLEFLK